MSNSSTRPLRTGPLRTRARRLAMGALGLVTLAGGLAVAAVPAQAAPVAETPGCSQQGKIEKTLENGTSWSMCWNMDAHKGLVLEAVYVKAPGDEGYRRVLDSLALAQLNVPYDTGENQWNDITSYGFGNQYLQKLDEAECPDGELIDVEQAWLQRSGTTNSYVTRTIPALCVQEVATGLSYRSHEQDWDSVEDGLLFTEQGTELVVSTTSKVDWYEYQSRYAFSDTGTIHSSLGATGDISPWDFADPAYGWPVGAADADFSTSHHHNAFWRVDFGIDEAREQKVRIFDSEVVGEGERAPLVGTTVTEVASPRTVDMAKRRKYNVYAPGSLNADEHARGYEIEFEENDPFEGNPETAPEITFTQYDACQEYATNNLNAECANQSVLDYAASEATISNPVAWVNVGFHHLVRDEDQSPMPVHWQGFELIARDFWAQNPLTPTARECVNGMPTDGNVDSTDACGHATTTALELSSTSVAAGEVPTATVSVAGPAEAVPTGTVSLVDGAELLGTAELYADGTVEIDLPDDLGSGEHSVVAAFAGADGTKWLPSTSEALTLTVAEAGTPAAATTTTKARAGTVKVGRRAVVRVAVSAEDATVPSGRVVVRKGGRVVGRATLTGGTANVRLQRLARGRHRLTVAYVGNARTAASSTPLTLRVVRR